MTGTRWLDEREQRAWRAYLAGSRLLSSQLDRELQHDSDLPHAYYEILVRLSEAPDRTLRMSELAEVSISSRSRLSHAVARLEEAGWVRRDTCPTDRRGAFAVLTPQGFAQLQAAAPGHVEGVRRHLLDRLSHEQIGQLEQIFTAVGEGLAGGHEDGAGCGPAGAPGDGPGGAAQTGPGGADRSGAGQTGPGGADRSGAGQLPASGLNRSIAGASRP